MTISTERLACCPFCGESAFLELMQGRKPYLGHKPMLIEVTYYPLYP